MGRHGDRADHPPRAVVARAAAQALEVIEPVYGMGWPRGRHGPVRRRPVSDVVSYDRWDEPEDDGL